MQKKKNNAHKCLQIPSGRESPGRESAILQKTSLSEVKTCSTLPSKCHSWSISAMGCLADHRRGNPKVDLKKKKMNECKYLGKNDIAKLENLNFTH